jgi:hypothetical protein
MSVDLSAACINSDEGVTDEHAAAPLRGTTLLQLPHLEQPRLHFSKKKNCKEKLSGKKIT